MLEAGKFEGPDKRERKLFLSVFSSSVLANWAVLSCTTWNKIGLDRWHFDTSVIPFYCFKANDRHRKWFTT